MAVVQPGLLCGPWVCSQSHPVSRKSTTTDIYTTNICSDENIHQYFNTVGWVEGKKREDIWLIKTSLKCLHVSFLSPVFYGGGNHRGFHGDNSGTNIFYSFHLHHFDSSKTQRQNALQHVSSQRNNLVMLQAMAWRHIIRGSAVLNDNPPTYSPTSAVHIMTRQKC